MCVLSWRLFKELLVCLLTVCRLGVNGIVLDVFAFVCLCCYVSFSRPTHTATCFAFESLWAGMISLPPLIRPQLSIV